MARPEVAYIEMQIGGFYIDLDWGDDNGTDFCMIASSRVRDYVRRLSYAKRVKRQSHYIFVWTDKPVGKKTIARLRRTINNKMPGIAFWTEMSVRRSRAKANHPSRRTRELGVTALTA